MKLRLGISTCPNDTFSFHAILNHKIDLLGLDFEILLLDVQELNELLAAGDLHCSKASFHAALHLADTYGVLTAGSALGIGVGPILVSRSNAEPTSDATIGCPGAWTTATLLFQLAYPDCPRIEHCLFSDIMPRVAAGTLDYGVLIHEGRFTYQQHNLTLAADLGDFYEKQTGSLLPLGGILARHDLGAEAHRKLTRVIRQSIEYGFANREETLSTMRQYAQELSDEAIWPHVDLYVNQYSLDLGEAGCAALSNLGQMAADHAIVENRSNPLQILAG